MEQQANESRLIYEIMRELGKYGAVFRTNAGGVKLPNGKIFHGLPKGFSDIIFVRYGGKACFIEAKVTPNKPSPEQAAFIDKMLGLGCYAGVAYSVDEALHICGIDGNLTIEKMEKELETVRGFRYVSFDNMEQVINQLSRDIEAEKLKGGT